MKKVEPVVREAERLVELRYLHELEEMVGKLRRELFASQQREERSRQSGRPVKRRTWLKRR